MEIPDVLDRLLLPLFWRWDRKPRIFMFHSVGYSDASLCTGEVGPRMDPETFRHFIVWLKEHVSVLTVAEVSRLSRRRKALRERVAAISFDDGYEDNFLTAYPILQSLRVPATVYMTGNMLRYHSEEIGDGLTVDQIRQMSTAGIEFGAHSMTHPRLSRIAPESARREILESKELIEDITKQPCDGFCYPYGVYDLAVRDLVQRLGFLYAVTTEDRIFGDCDVFQLQRTVLPANAGPTDFAIRLSGAHAWRQSLFRAARGVHRLLR